MVKTALINDALVPTLNGIPCTCKAKHKKIFFLLNIYVQITQYIEVSVKK